MSDLYCAQTVASLPILLLPRHRSPPLRLSHNHVGGANRQGWQCENQMTGSREIRSIDYKWAPVTVVTEVVWPVSILLISELGLCIDKICLATATIPLPSQHNNEQKNCSVRGLTDN
ncbi:adenosylcobalamin-dependent ribonucleoside-diphosphate [Sesbania bispinosa]|nr:adenosylcobalamin-dependent ribonucleoside-diphosphate [Sesbania bispinosa]